MIKFIFLFLFMPTLAFADRVCLEKSTGKLIEYQSGNASLGTLIQNAINSGYKKDDVVEKYITPQEWEIIKKQWIDEPTQEKLKQKEIENKQKEKKLRQKLNLTEEDFQDLEEVLKD